MPTLSEFAASRRSVSSHVSPPSPPCRFCGSALRHTFVDLGMSPLCESYVEPDGLNEMEPFYPLHVRVCASCFLVQVEEYVAPEAIFTEYAYFSAFSDSWVSHARDYTETMVRNLGLDESSRVVEVASNDGYLLQHFVARGIPVLGVDPAANVAAAARERGVETVTAFFGAATAQALAKERGRADLLVANNVFAHVPDLNDFVEGLRTMLSDRGTLTLEFPHLWRLIDDRQFDTIYHEHFSYFSFVTAERVLAAHGLTVFDVQELETHGGSLRLHARHAADAMRPVRPSVIELRARERAAGFETLGLYEDFGPRVAEAKRRLLELLMGAKDAGKSIAGYGAPGKGNTLLNYCGIGTDFLDYTVDLNPYKQGLFLPGTHIPILHPGRLEETRPDYILILPWNLREEIMRQLAPAREWGARFVVPIPDARVYD